MWEARRVNTLKHWIHGISFQNKNHINTHSGAYPRLHWEKAKNSILNNYNEWNGSECFLYIEGFVFLLKACFWLRQFPCSGILFSKPFIFMTDFLFCCSFSWRFGETCHMLYIREKANQANQYILIVSLQFQHEPQHSHLHQDISPLPSLLMFSERYLPAY